MKRELFSKRPQPYYIYAPDYRRSSAGIRVMHMLCDALNRSGHEAYVVCSVLNPQLITPCLTDEVMALHRAQGLEPIVVYPEIIDGNPLAGKVVVRYLLNKPGHLGGTGDYGRDDLFFVYMRGLLQPGIPEQNILHCPAIDLSIFKPPTDPAKRVPGKVCYYQGRGGQAKLDPTLLSPDAVEITPAYPASWEDLADLFQQCEYFYLGERSGLAAEAALCGCISIVVPGKWAPEPLSLSENNSYGTAWGNTPEAIERARDTLHLLAERQVRHHADFWLALDHFIEITQAAGERMASGDRRGHLSWLRERCPDRRQLELMTQQLAESHVPGIAVVVQVTGDDCAALGRTLDSLRQSLYAPSQVWVMGGEPVAAAGIQWLSCEAVSPAATVNEVVRQTPCEWLLLVQAGVEFSTSGLLMIALALTRTPESCRAVYADEAVRLENGVVEVVLRPDLNLDLLLSYPGSHSKHWLYRRESLLQLDGFAVNSATAYELEYQLRLIMQDGLAGIRHVSEPLLIADAARAGAHADESAVIAAHLRQRGYPTAQALPLAHAPGRYRIDYQHVRRPSVSILIYLEGELLRLQRCLEILLAQTAYDDYEVVLIEPGRADASLVQWLDMVAQIDHQRFQVLRFMPGQSRAAMCNAAAEDARGEYLVWFDAGVGVLEKDWLQALLNHAQRPEVGAVGGKLQTGVGAVYGAGLVLGLGGTVGSAFEGASHHDGGYMGRLGLDHNCAVLAQECLMLRRQVFLEQGGFEVESLLTPWITLDLCLRLQEAGYLNVWTPYARLLIDPFSSDAASAEEEEALYARWLPRLSCDSSYNANFALHSGVGFRLQSNALSWRPLQGIAPTVLVMNVNRDEGIQSRLTEPLHALSKAGLVGGAVTTELLPLVEIERYAPTSIVLQHQLDDACLRTLRHLRAFSDVFKVYDLSGYLPELESVDDFAQDEWVRRLGGTLMHVDRVVVASPALAQMLKGAHEDIRVIESGLPDSWAKLAGERRTAERPRLGWQVTKDSELLSEVVPALAHEVDWIVLGDCPASLRPFVAEQHPAPPPQHLGQTLAALNLDLALVPMEDTLVNACCADLRVLQHAACAHPVICSRVPGLVGGECLPLTRVGNDSLEWLRAIKLHLDDREASAALGDALQQSVRANWLYCGLHLEAWREAWIP